MKWSELEIGRLFNLFLFGCHFFLQLLFLTGSTRLSRIKLFPTTAGTINFCLNRKSAAGFGNFKINKIFRIARMADMAAFSVHFAPIVNHGSRRTKTPGIVGSAVNFKPCPTRIKITAACPAENSKVVSLSRLNFSQIFKIIPIFIINFGLSANTISTDWCRNRRCCRCRR